MRGAHCDLQQRTGVKELLKCIRASQAPAVEQFLVGFCFVTLAERGPSLAHITGGGYGLAS